MTRRFTRSVATLALGAAALAAAGCANTSDSNSGSSDGEVVVGYAGYTVANPFFAGIKLGLERGAKTHGYKLLQANANGDAAQQFTDVQNLLNKGIDYLVITPIDAKANGPAVKAAKAKGVPVIALADGIAGAPVTVTLAQDHYKAAVQATEYLVELLEKKNGSASGNVVDIMGLAGVPAAAPREKGFKDVIAKNPNVTVVARQDGGFDTEKANTVMTDILQANKDLDAVYAANDAEAVGVTAAIKRAGRFKPVGDPDHIIVVSIDGPKPAIESVRAGEQDASISQNPLKMAIKAIDVIAELVDGTTVPETIEWPSQLITLDNIDSPEVKEYGIWADEVG